MGQDSYLNKGLLGVHRKGPEKEELTNGSSVPDVNASCQTLLW